MDVVASNIEYLQRKLRAKSISALAAKLGMSQPTLARIYNNKTSEPRMSTIKPLADAAGVSELSFMLVDLGKADREASLIDERGSVLPWEEADDLPLDPDRVWVDRYDFEVSAGSGAAVQWEVREKAKLPFSLGFFRKKNANPRDCKLILVRGKSMEPFLFDHDLAMIDTADTKAVDGEVYAVYYDDESYVKQVFRLPGGGLRLHSYNPTYRDVEIEGSQLELVRIVGRVIYRSG